MQVSTCERASTEAAPPPQVNACKEPPVLLLLRTGGFLCLLDILYHFGYLILPVSIGKRRGGRVKLTFPLPHAVGARLRNTGQSRS
ncbi:hypothetical protein SAMN06296065_103281 [Novosphingobium panipatense]|uniref:Uncharacterized protein n=1 Tax=Novosphingobium panipatense TaxID=428991 RepID=A0ABY1Q6W3_9SPHN|nr:hypothetical protein SAMN06296065_103281 [Novosphingobium panipatense]